MSRRLFTIAKCLIRLLLRLGVTVSLIFGLLVILRILTPSYESGLQFMEDNRTDKDAFQKQRLERARNFLSKFDWSTLNQTEHGKDLSIVIIASNRTGFYLTEVVAETLRIFNNVTKKPFIALCNVNSGKRFSELETFEGKILIVDVDSSAKYDLSSVDARIWKESSDYWKCLNESLKFATDYVLLLEDDAVPIERFHTIMQSLLSQLKNRPYIDYVKLYHPRILRKIPSLIQTLAFILVVGIIVHRWWHNNLFTLIACLCIYLLIRTEFSNLFAEFRYHLTRSVYLSPTESCCTPAVIFKSSKIHSIVAKLSEISATNGHAKDHILDESVYFGKATDLNLIIHIGEFSSIRNKHVNIELNENNFIYNLLSYLQNKIY